MRSFSKRWQRRQCGAWTTTLSIDLVDLLRAIGGATARGGRRRRFRKVFRSFREVFGRQRREKILEMMDNAAAIISVKKSLKSELSSQFFGRLKFLVIFWLVQGLSLPRSPPRLPWIEELAPPLAGPTNPT